MKPQELKNYIGSIVREPELHAKWLNTFSYLEYIGFRKIVKSQAAESMSFETLSHAVEEGRHALRLKRLALKAGGEKFNSYDPATLLCGTEAEAYFQSLDRYCDGCFKHLPEKTRARLTYLYVTWLVEIRALEVYGVYQSVLSESGGEPVLNALLKEEEGHLSYVKDELEKIDPLFRTNFQQLKKIEQELYENYLRALEATNAIRV